MTNDVQPLEMLTIWSVLCTILAIEGLKVNYKGRKGRLYGITSLNQRRRRQLRQKRTIDGAFDNADEDIDISLNENDVRIRLVRKEDHDRVRVSDEVSEVGSPPQLIHENDMLARMRRASTKFDDKVTSESMKSSTSELERDMIEFQRNQAASSGMNVKDARSSGGIFASTKSVLSYVLVVDFFAIIVFLVWFISATIQKEFMGDAWLLERFQDIFMPVVQPALGLLMIGSVLSKAGDAKDEEKDV